MPTFEIQDANGKSYEVDGPDMMTAANAFRKWTPPATSEDVGKSAVSGLSGGTASLIGSLGDLTNIGAKGIGIASDYINDKLGLPRYQPPAERGPIATALNKIPTGADVSKVIQDRLFNGEAPYEPQSTAGKYAKSVGEMLPGSMLGPGGLAGRIVSGVAAGLGSEAAGEAAKGNAYEPVARVAGALAGGLSPNGIARTLTPLPAPAARERLVNILADEGVDSLTAGQRTGNKSLQYLESAASNSPLGGGGAERVAQRGQQQFTEAAMRRAGAGPDATPEVLANNNVRLGQEFRDLSARNTLVPDNQFVNDVVDAARNYRRVPDSQQRQMVQGYIDDIVQHVNNGGMPGPQYQEMRSRLSRQANNLRQSDPTLSQALRDMRNALDNAMARSINPADAEAWQAARAQYGAQKVIEKAASRAGEATAEGQIVPANLRNTVAAENRGAYARGQGAFSELSRAGSAIMAPLPNSGTAQRLNAFSLLNNATAGLIPAATGRAIMSRPVQAWLGNQVLTPLLRDNRTRQRALFDALMESSRLKLSDQRAQNSR